MDHQSTEILVRVEAEDLDLTIEWADLANGIPPCRQPHHRRLGSCFEENPYRAGSRQYTHQSPTDAALLKPRL